MNNSTNHTAALRVDDISIASNIINISIFIISVIGNLFVILTVYSNKRLRTTLNYLVVNLSICDIMIVTFTIPFSMILQRYQEEGYIFGAFGCRVISPLATLSSNAAVFALLCITIERYIAIVHPLKWTSQKNHALKFIISTYVYSLVTVIPFGYYLELEVSSDGLSRCNEKWSIKASKAYTILLFLLQYGIPLPLMIGIYTKAWFEIKTQNDHTIKVSEEQRKSRGMSVADDNQTNPTRNGISRKVRESITSEGSYREEMTYMCFTNCLFCFNPNLVRTFLGNHDSVDTSSYIANKRRRQTIRTFIMFLLIVVIFAVCSLPNQIAWLWMSFFAESATLISLMPIFYMLHYSNCVLNPLIYGGLNRTFRDGYKRVARCDSVAHDKTFYSNIVSSEHNQNFKKDKNELFKDGIITRNPVSFIECGSIESIYKECEDEEVKEIKTDKRRVKFHLSVVSNKKLSIEKERRKLSISLTTSRQRKLTLPLLSSENSKDKNASDKFKRKLSLPTLHSSFGSQDSLSILPANEKLNRNYTAPFRRLSNIVRAYPKFDRKKEIILSESKSEDDMNIYAHVESGQQVGLQDKKTNIWLSDGNADLGNSDTCLNSGVQEVAEVNPRCNELSKDAEDDAENDTMMYADNGIEIGLAENCAGGSAIYSSTSHFNNTKNTKSHFPNPPNSDTPDENLRSMQYDFNQLANAKETYI